MTASSTISPGRATPLRRCRASDSECHERGPLNSGGFRALLLSEVSWEVQGARTRRNGRFRCLFPGARHGPGRGVKALVVATATADETDAPVVQWVANPVMTGVLVGVSGSIFSVSSEGDQVSSHVRKALWSSGSINAAT
eukprot:CAMPEP_0113954282 /NCGR_PEP_ID=MMETSP0011_2-20120614/420_1 /TAXON_ID=101924 /ORGANISM="Rhodosorus marinus" /LENGTH=139 /DNA_ID=CAMNT_0000963301 /DNA_START=236 /DNA_END=656 /DNA_ORIENTATION=+ /assembly_acc=CAM_ASM_000156